MECFIDSVPPSLLPCIKLRTLSIYLLVVFNSNDPHWHVLDTVASVHLKEIKVNFFGLFETNVPPLGWQKVDDILCQCYDRSYEADKTLHVSLRLSERWSDDLKERWTVRVNELWPKFCRKGKEVVSVVPRTLH